ncbi:condensation domain-containing protein [Vibrio cincinnatiensis]|nr:condensation domain-containing protein [Vibrio cincinnatiensis]
MQYLSFLFHHVVLDEWSVNLLMDDLREAYQARAKGYVSKWQSQPLAFSEYAARQHDSGRDESHLAYWLAQFEGVPLHAPLLPELQNQPNSEPSDAGGWVEFKLSTEVVQGLYQLAREQGASLFNVVYAAIALTLKKLGAPNSLIIGTPTSGRLDANFFDTVGYFTTLAMHVVHFDRAHSVAELIAQVKNTINESLNYSDVPIDWVEDALLGEQTRKQHLFEVMIQLHAKNKLHGELVGDQTMVRFEQVDPEKSESALGLQFEVMEERVGGEDRIRVLMSYRSDRYGDAQVKMLTHATQSMLEQFAQPQSGNQRLNLEEEKQ